MRPVTDSTVAFALRAIDCILTVIRMPLRAVRLARIDGEDALGMEIEDMVSVFRRHKVKGVYAAGVSTDVMHTVTLGYCSIKLLIRETVTTVAARILESSVTGGCETGSPLPATIWRKNKLVEEPDRGVDRIPATFPKLRPVRHHTDSNSDRSSRQRRCVPRHMPIRDRPITGRVKGETNSKMAVKRSQARRTSAAHSGLGHNVARVLPDRKQLYQAKPRATPRVRRITGYSFP